MCSEEFDLQEALDRIQNCSFVLFTDTLGNDVQQLAERLRLPLQVAHIRKSSGSWPVNPDELNLARAALEPEMQLVEKLKKNKVVQNNG